MTFDQRANAAMMTRESEFLTFFFFFKDVLFTNDGLFLDAVVKIRI